MGFLWHPHQYFYQAKIVFFQVPLCAVTWMKLTYSYMKFKSKRFDSLSSCCCILVLVLGTSLFESCKDRIDEHAVVRALAQQYYDSLMVGNYEWFVSGMAGTDSLPHSYRQQMIDMIAQHVDEMRTKGGMVKAVATRDSLLDSVAYVFLDVTFGDSTVEQVGVKMVRERNLWKMK